MIILAKKSTKKAVEKKEIKIRVTEKEYDKIKEKADAKRMSLQEYVTTAAMNRREKKPEYKEYPPEFMDAVYAHQQEVAQLNQTIREFINAGHTDESIWYSFLEDAAVSLRHLCREETKLFIMIGGEENNGNTDTV